MRRSTERGRGLGYTLLCFGPNSAVILASRPTRQMRAAIRTVECKSNSMRISHRTELTPAEKEAKTKGGPRTSLSISRLGPGLVSRPLSDAGSYDPRRPLARFRCQECASLIDAGSDRVMTSFLDGTLGVRPRYPTAAKGHERITRGKGVRRVGQRGVVSIRRVKSPNDQGTGRL